MIFVILFAGCSVSFELTPLDELDGFSIHDCWALHELGLVWRL